MKNDESEKQPNISNVTLKNVVFGFSIFYIIATLLLGFKILTGLEYIAYLAIFLVASFLIISGDKVIEFSLGGNVVKLKETTEEAKVLIKQLKEAKIDIFKLILENDLHDSSHWGGEVNLVESRATKFIKTFNKIEKENCLDNLKMEVSKGTEELLQCQLDGIVKYFKPSIDLVEEFGMKPSPDQIISSLKEEIISECVNPNLDYVKLHNFENAREQFYLAISQYQKLIQIQNKIAILS